MECDIGIIGGTGVYDPELFENTEERSVKTPYGEPSDVVKIGELSGKRVAFLPRHGSEHSYPPHNVPYRANIYAMDKIGVERIIAPQAVGSLKEELDPGTVVLPDQFIDRTKSRNDTFFDEGDVAHISTAEPFCPDLRSTVLRETDIDIVDGGTYVCIEGPRFSTKAESEWFRSNGFDIIGMTLVPEAVLAREREICYSSISTVTDYDCWRDEEVSAEMVQEVARKNLEKTKNIIEAVVPEISEKRNCECGNALEGAFI